MTEPVTESIEVLSDISPYGLVQAVVEQDERVIYFYLFGAEHTDFGMRSCWVRNLRPAPESDISMSATGTLSSIAQ